jgi:hypothetical protein
MKYLLKLILLAFLTSLGLVIYSVIPKDRIPPIPPLASVPIPKERPTPPSEVLKGQSGAHMCVTYGFKPARIPGTNLVYQKMIAKGMKPCHLLEGGSFDWYMNGRDL